MTGDTCSTGIQHSDVPHYGTEEQMNDSSIATRYTTNHGLKDADEDVTFAFICPQCDNKNPLKGDPEGFANKPFACLECRYISLLPSEAILEFKRSVDTDT